MGLLDGLFGGGAGGGASPLQSILMAALANQSGQQGQQGQSGGLLGGLLGGGGAAAGIGGLVSAFQQAGLGHIAESWINNGPNHPVSPDQLQTVFGDDQVQTMSAQTGMQPHDMLSQLSQMLPNLVDRMTPTGQAPPH